MIYADWDFYVNEYMGNTINQDDFNRLARKASAFLDYYTQGKAVYNSALDAVKLACCAVAEQCQIAETALAAASAGFSSDNGLESQKVGDWSKTYRSGGATATGALAAVESAKAQYASAAAMYLANTGLLYRGNGRARAEVDAMQEAFKTGSVFAVANDE